ncbi:MAG: NAD(P)/FAD-dependent oxidoreductase [bacterium]|nr:NAD(P)/FAD-dependent oxidoreductase [bacterium]
MSPKKKIVILGAGFGGVRAATDICRNLAKLNLNGKYEVVLVDRNHYHTYVPILYEVATTSKDVANQIKLKDIVTFHLKDIFQNHCVTIKEATVSEIDLIEGDVHFQDAEKLKFDYLVLALGSETNYFDIPGLKENSYGLKTFGDAIRVRDAVWDLVDSRASNEEIKIIVGGGGATGVETAGEIKAWICELDEKFKKCPASVKIIEAMPTVLAGLDQKVVKRVLKRLKAINVELVLNEAIEKVEPKKVFLKSGTMIPFDVLVWTGGAKASSLMTGLPLKKEKRGRVEVPGVMQCLPQTEDLKFYGKIYGLGDAICFTNAKTGRPIPQVAEAAIEQAKVVAHNIIEDIKEAEGLKPKSQPIHYIPREYPYIITAGGKYAVAKMGPIVIGGFFGWILKGLVELYYLLFNVLPPFQAIRIWLKGLWIFIKNDRLG